MPPSSVTGHETVFPFDLFRSFLPLHNPIGFGAADFLELALAALLVILALGWARFGNALRRLAPRTLWCMGILAPLPAALRLALLPHCPVPTPSGADDFSYLLLADTLRHFRLANATHPLFPFFEAVFVLQHPHYASIFPLGQAMPLAIGWIALGHPWAGVVLSECALCALCYWMLRGWVAPQWALLGGALAVIEFGPLNAWMNTYWGGAVSACAGCLVFGALPRLRRQPRTRDAVLLGVGIGLQLLTRPFECILLVACVVCFVPWRQAWKPVAFAIAPAILVVALQNRAVTNSWTTMPYILSRYEYGVPATFTFQPNPIPHRQLTPEQQLDYQAQAAIHGDGPDTPRRFLQRFADRLRFVRFF